MDIKQSPPNNQPSGTDLGHAEEIVNSSIVSQFSYRTMARDLEALAEKPSHGKVSLFVKPAAAKPGPQKLLVPDSLKVSPPTPMSPAPPQAFKPPAPPTDLPIAKKASIEMTKPTEVPPPPPVRTTPEPIPSESKSLAQEAEAILGQAIPAPKEKPPTSPVSTKTVNKKLYLLIGIVIAAVLILGLGGWFLWRALGPAPTGTPTPSLAQTPSLTPSFSPTPTPLVLPQPPFTMEKQQMINLTQTQATPISEALQSLTESAAGGTFTRVAFKTTPENETERLLTFNEFASFFNLTTFGPAASISSSATSTSSSSTAYLRDSFDQNQYFPFIYYQTQDGSSPFSAGMYPARFGLIATLKDGVKVADVNKILKNLEPTMPEELKDLILFTSSSTEIPESPKFTGNTYKDIGIRYVNFPYSTLTLDYAITNNYFVLTTSKEAMYAVIDRLSAQSITASSTESSTTIESQSATNNIVDCGTVGPSNPDPTGKVKDCVATMFKECQPAKYTTSLDLGQMGGLVTYYYEIIGPSNNLCTVKSKFLQNPNPDWIGKEMTCEYDNSKDFETAVKDTSKCSGPLYDIMGGPQTTL